MNETAQELVDRARALVEGDPSSLDPKDLAESVLAALTDEQRTDVAERFEKKEVGRRFPELTDVLLDLVNGPKRLVVGETVEERVEQYLAFVAHSRALWHDACDMFERGRFGTATFLAVACMEEVGKAGVAKLQVLMSPSLDPSVPARKARSALYSHTKKHLLVAGQGALINRRLDRLLGLDRVAHFLDDVDNGRIELVRQSALYADHDGAKPVIPDLAITHDDALFYVALAGEVMAEILGAAPEIWSELLDEVKAFEAQHGIAIADDA